MSDPLTASTSLGTSLDGSLDDPLAIEAALQRRWPETRIEPSLDRMRALMELMGEPQRTFPAVHITGTNGKSSTARMIDDLFRAQGLRTGRFTSPHLQTVRDRICIDGRPIDPARFAGLYAEVAPYLQLVDEGTGIAEGQQVHPVSFFEAVTAMAYAAFADAPVDVAVIEVGMGGAWDATNVVDGQVAVITPIALDHADYLGNSPADIAIEKSGIIKTGGTAILAAQEQRVAEVLLARCAEVSAVAAREGVEFGVVDRQVAVGGQSLTIQGLHARYDDLVLPVFGVHQASNAACAIAAVEAFFGPERALPADLVQEAFTGMSAPGRLEIVRTSPTTLVDAAHNPAGMRASLDAVAEAFDFSRLVGVFAASADKDIAGMVELLEPVLDEIVVTTNNSPRSHDIDATARIVVEHFGADRVTVEPSLPDAIETAVRLAEDQEHLSGSGVLITGSVYTAGDARLLFGSDKPKPWENRPDDGS